MGGHARYPGFTPAQFTLLSRLISIFDFAHAEKPRVFRFCARRKTTGRKTHENTPIPLCTVHREKKTKNITFSTM